MVRLRYPWDRAASTFLDVYWRERNASLPDSVTATFVSNPDSSRDDRLNEAGVTIGVTTAAMEAVREYAVSLESALARGDDLSKILAGTIRGATWCECLGADIFSGHTVAEHERESCGGQTFDPPCGGCYDCVARQHAYNAASEPPAHSPNHRALYEVGDKRYAVSLAFAPPEKVEALRRSIADSEGLHSPEVVPVLIKDDVQVPWVNARDYSDAVEILISGDVAKASGMLANLGFMVTLFLGR